jgi:hypothetical protein
VERTSSRAGLTPDPHRDHRWDFPCCVWSPSPACRRQCPGRIDGICSLVLFHRLRPSPKPGRVGSCIILFEACSACRRSLKRLGKHAGRNVSLEELQRRNYAETTIRHYIRTVEDIARRFNCPPDRLGPRHIREFQAELFQKRKLSPNSVVRHLAALQFFYIKTLKRSWSIAETPYPKWVFHLPTILSQEEGAQLIDAARTPYHRTLLMTLYATGTRRAELTRLKASDIDSQRMVILCIPKTRSAGDERSNAPPKLSCFRPILAWQE